MQSPGEKSPPVELRIVLDDTARTYAPGAPITGTVEVRVLEACRCRGLSLSLLWKTRGDGSSQQCTLRQLQLFEGEWQTDRFLRYRFELEAPAGPPTYHGDHLAMDWYLRAQVDIRGRSGSRQHVLEEQLVLLPAESAHPLVYLPGQWRRLLKLPPAPASVDTGFPSPGFWLSVFSLFLHLALALVVPSPGLLVLSFVVSFVWIVQWASAGSGTPSDVWDGFLDLQLGSQVVSPGGGLPLRVRMQAGCAFILERFSVSIRGEEVMGRVPNLFCSPNRFPWFSEEVLANETQTLQAYEVLESDLLEIQLPEDAPASFWVGDSGVRWYVRVELRLVIPEGGAEGGDEIIDRTIEVPFLVSQPSRRTSVVQNPDPSRAGSLPESLEIASDA